MPLSEHEERILAEIERQLAREDPSLASRAARRRRSVGSPVWRLRLSVAAFVVGFVCLLGITFAFALGVVGFALMFVAVVVAASVLRDVSDDSSPADRFREAFGRSEADS